MIFAIDAKVNPVDEEKWTGENENVAIMTLTPESPWKSPDIFPVRPDTSEYGYLAGKKMVGCSREELIKRCSRDEIPAIHLVWTSETPRLVPPAEVAFLFDGIRLRSRKRCKAALWSGIANCFIWGMMALLNLNTGGAGGISLLPFLFLGVMPTIQGVQGLRKLRSYSPEAMAAEIDIVRSATWVQTRNVVFTWVLLACISVVGLAQLFCGLEKSIEAAGLVKSAVWHGQAWRLVTCAMLHGSILHFVFNASALLQLGRVTEVLTHRVYLVIVFATSALIGSLFSLFLLPNITSIGASGGLLGLIGFLAAFGYYHKHSLPPGFLRSILLSIAFIAGIGLFAHQYIDNACHFGGLVSGIALGMLLINRTDPNFASVPSKSALLLGWFAVGAILLTTFLSLYEIAK